MRIGCSGPVSERTGIGVVQKHLYSYLVNAGHELVHSETRDMGRSPVGVARGLVRGFRPADGPMDAYLSTVPPFAYRIHAPTLSVIHDLRWMRTRTRLGAKYRAWDLRRTVLGSEALVCISENTRLDLINFEPRASPKAVVKWLGTGQVPEGSFKDSESGLVMLVGDAPHKRNELAAAALAAARPAWVRGIIGVGVSNKVQDVLSNVFPCRWYRGVSDTEMLSLYSRAECFLMLGTDEGFGLPFVEALASGCQVIAADHLLAREVLGDAGVLVAANDLSEISRRLSCRPAVSEEVRAQHVKRFSWRAFGEDCEAQLKAIAKAGRC